MGQLGVNAHGEVLEAGRMPDCSLGLRLEPTDDGHVAGVLVVARPRCCIRSCRSRMAACCTSC